MRATRGADDWGAWLEQALGSDDRARQGMFARARAGIGSRADDRYLLRTLNLEAIKREPGAVRRKVAVVIDFAEFVVPAVTRCSSLPLQRQRRQDAGWANDSRDPSGQHRDGTISEGLHDLNELVAGNPHASAIHLPLPNESEMPEYVRALEASQFPHLRASCDVSIDVLATRLTGLSRVGARTAIALALGNDRRITAAWLVQIKKEIIERECQGLLEFIESPFTLDDVAGLDSVKAWLREDAQLLRRGALRALPMGI